MILIWIADKVPERQVGNCWNISSDNCKIVVSRMINGPFVKATFKGILSGIAYDVCFKLIRWIVWKSDIQFSPFSCKHEKNIPKIAAKLISTCSPKTTKFSLRQLSSFEWIVHLINNTRSFIIILDEKCKMIFLWI